MSGGARRAGSFGLGLGLALVLCLGFDWPMRAERLIAALQQASTPRDKRDVLRLLRDLQQRGGLGANVDLSAVEVASRDPEAAVRADAWLLLGTLRRDVASLAPALRDPAPSVRLVALANLTRAEGEALEGADDAARRNALLRVAADDEPTVRAAGLRALARLDDARVLPLLTRALRGEPLEVQLAAAFALGARPEPSALETLRVGSEGALPELRTAALDALPASTDLRARAMCERALDDDDEAVALAARRCLSRLRRGVAGAQPEQAPSHTRPRDELAEDVGRDPAWLAPLERTAAHDLTERDASLLLRTLESAIGQGDELAADPLLDWLPRAPKALRVRISRLIERTAARIDATVVVPWVEQTTSPALRAAYVRLLSQGASPTARARLLRALDDAAPEVRRAAVFALSRTLQDEDLPALIARLRDSDDDEARRGDTLALLAESLARRAGVKQTTSSLVSALAHEVERPNDANAALALRALGFVGEKRARTLVREALDDARPGRVLAALRASVPDRSEVACRLRAKLLAHHDARIAAMAAIALTLAGDPIPAARLIPWLDGAAWPRGPAASFALLQASQRSAIADFDPCRWLASEEPIIRANMIAALLPRASVACADALRASRAESGAHPHARRRAGEPAAWIRQDSSVIVSLADASGRVDWPELGVATEVSAFLTLDVSR